MYISGARQPRVLGGLLFLFSPGPLLTEAEIRQFYLWLHNTSGLLEVNQNIGRSYI